MGGSAGDGEGAGGGVGGGGFDFIMDWPKKAKVQEKRQHSTTNK